MAIDTIGTNAITNDAVTAAKIPAGAVNADITAIPDGSVSTAKIADNAVTGAKLYAENLGRRNLLINGAMQISQRSTSAFSITNATNTYTLDRFRGNASGGGVFSVQQVSDSPVGFINSAKVTVTTADASISSSDFYHLRQTVEGYNFSPLAYGTSDAKTMTLSFYVKSSVAGAYNIVFRNNAGNRGYIVTYTINSTNTWERKIISIGGDVTGTWPTDNTGSLIVSWSFGGNNTATINQWGTSVLEKSSGTVDLIATLNATWQITGCQLEIGDAATDFEHRSFGEEKVLCQRYFQTFAAAVGRTSTGTPFGCFDIRPNMRAEPTATRLGSAISSNEVGTTITVDFANAGSLTTDAIQRVTYYNDTNQGTVAGAGGVGTLDAEI